jgi:hypothetical protein
MADITKPKTDITQPQRRDVTQPRVDLTAPDSYLKNSPDFDIDAWEAGHYSQAQGEDFDVEKWENANTPSPTSVEGRPQIQPPYVDPEEDQGPVPAGKLSGLPGVNPHTPSTKEAVGDVALAATPIAGAMTADAVPALVKTLSAAAKSHPFIAQIIKRGLEGSALEAGWKLSKKVFGE